MPRRQAQANPSWIVVIATTLRLWVRRRVLHVPDNGRVSRLRGTVLGAVAIIVVAAVVVAVVALTRPSAATDTRRAASRPSLTPAQVQARAAETAAVAANGRAAATWIAAQVSPATVLGCDPGMCAAILAAGYSAGGQTVLQPGVTLPAAGALVIATPVVRDQYGPGLAAAAPGVIATFGSGQAAVQVRVSAVGGQQAYAQAASGALAARQKAGSKLASHRNVHVRGGARSDLTAGKVDPRLISALRRVAAHYPVYIFHFGDSGPLASPAVPFRMAEIVGLTSARHGHKASELAAVESLLRHGGSHGKLSVLHLPGGKLGLKIEFPAPSPF